MSISRSVTFCLNHMLRSRISGWRCKCAYYNAKKHDLSHTKMGVYGILDTYYYYTAADGSHDGVSDSHHEFEISTTCISQIVYRYHLLGVDQVSLGVSSSIHIKHNGTSRQRLYKNLLAMLIRWQSGNKAFISWFYLITNAHCVWRKGKHTKWELTFGTDL